MTGTKEKLEVMVSTLTEQSLKLEEVSDEIEVHVYGAVLARFLKLYRFTSVCSKEDNFSDFLFAYLEDRPIKGSTLNGKNLLQ